MAILRSPARLAALGLVLAALVVGALYVVPAGDTYIVLPDRAKPLEDRIEVGGRTPPEDRGDIYFVDVIVRRATWLERLAPSLWDGASLLPAHAINPAGVSEEQRRRANRVEMTRSQRIAAAVALREAGYLVQVRTRGVLVVQVLPDGPSQGTLRPGDVIVAVAGRPVRTLSDLRRLLGERRPGARVPLRVRRDGRTLTPAIRATASPADARRAFLGVLVEQAADVDLPVPVEIDIGAVGGPSAGLAFALALLEALGEDVDRGRKVAVTGELHLDGTVARVGGIKQKTIGARRSNVDVFLVPAANAEEARANANGLRVVAVRTFEQALRALTTAAADGQD